MFDDHALHRPCFIDDFLLIFYDRLLQITAGTEKAPGRTCLKLINAWAFIR
jgi:hypothetical protein